MWQREYFIYHLILKAFLRYAPRSMLTARDLWIFHVAFFAALLNQSRILAESSTKSSSGKLSPFSTVPLRQLAGDIVREPLPSLRPAWKTNWNVRDNREQFCVRSPKQWRRLRFQFPFDSGRTVDNYDAFHATRSRERFLSRVLIEKRTRGLNLTRG